MALCDVSTIEMTCTVSGGTLKLFLYCFSTFFLNGTLWRALLPELHAVAQAFILLHMDRNLVFLYLVMLVKSLIDTGLCDAVIVASVSR